MKISARTWKFLCKQYRRTLIRRYKAAQAAGAMATALEAYAPNDKALIDYLNIVSPEYR